MNNITVETTLHQDSEGREYLQFTPVLKARVIASGELRFAHWQAYLDEPETHASQKANALKTGRESLAALLADVSR